MKTKRTKAESILKVCIPFTLGLLLTTISSIAAEKTVLIDFDNGDNWRLGSSASRLNHYDVDHSYIDAGWKFTGGEALRNTTTAVNGYPGALGAYSWRLRDGGGVVWTAAHQGELMPNEHFIEFSFQARRWSDSPEPRFTVEYSRDNGSGWLSATAIGSEGILNNHAFAGSNDWVTFKQSLEDTGNSPADQLKVRLSSDGGERIMVDNFTVRIIPEPSTISLFGFAFMAMLMSKPGARRFV